VKQAQRVSEEILVYRAKVQEVNACPPLELMGASSGSVNFYYTNEFFFAKGSVNM